MWYAYIFVYEIRFIILSSLILCILIFALDAQSKKSITNNASISPSIKLKKNKNNSNAILNSNTNILSRIKPDDEPANSSFTAKEGNF